MIIRTIITTIITITLLNPLNPADTIKLWGISQAELISRLKLENYTSFRPEEKPEYSNRVIDFFSAMNPEDRGMINIIKAQGTPETDYCFFNEKLYSITEEWKNTDRVNAHRLLLELKAKYNEPSVEEKNSSTVYSFKKGKTKVLVYKKTIDEKNLQIKIFYYSTDLFSMFLME